LVAAGVTQGDIKIEGCEPSHLQAVINKLRQTGITIEQEPGGLRAIGAETISSTDVKTLPYPGFPTDMQAQFMVLMCLANGLSVTPVMATDLRASASLILAGLAAEGITEVSRVYHIDRGYELIEKKLTQLGGHLERVPE
jgi:UDP-N-acetylglucosamine 1-carboxyvinyltransferase